MYRLRFFWPNLNLIHFIIVFRLFVQLILNKDFEENFFFRHFFSHGKFFDMVKDTVVSQFNSLQDTVLFIDIDFLTEVYINYCLIVIG